MEIETEYLLNVDIDIASTEFEYFCSQGYSLSTLLRSKRLKTATALVQFRLELVGGRSLETAGIEFKPAPGGQCFLDYYPGDISYESVLDEMASPISELLFNDFVMYLGQRGYVQGHTDSAQASRSRLMAELRNFGDKVSRYAAELIERHRVERESLPAKADPGLRGIIGGLADLTQGMELRILDQLIETLEWYSAEYAEFPQLASSGSHRGEKRASSTGYVERKIIEAVSQLRANGIKTTDEAVAAKVKFGSKGKPYTRETINRYRQRMRKLGIDV